MVHLLPLLSIFYPYSIHIPRTCSNSNKASPQTQLLLQLLGYLLPLLEPGKEPTLPRLKPRTLHLAHLLLLVRRLLVRPTAQRRVERVPLPGAAGVNLVHPEAVGGLDL